ncbi:MAG TPA: histone deacetylase family protein, partial [Promineifilum sp.]|nr:histone deacetylase family protein [Promineifilum sp.]
ILAAHAADFVTYLQTAYAQSAAYFGAARPVIAARDDVTFERAPSCPEDFPGKRDYYTYDYEDPILELTWDAAYWAAQCALTAADVARNGERAAYALCRPPGHHAMPDQYGGFCYLNNVAIAARYLQADGPVAILDLDYHHGNGTQAIFYERADVFFCSLHADPADEYPYYSGYPDEMGAGQGEGATLNIPLPQATGEAGYLRALDWALAAVDAVSPDMLVVSLGFDTLSGDPHGGMGLTPAAFRPIGQSLAALGRPTLLVQEGGYQLGMLGPALLALLEGLGEATGGGDAVAARLPKPDAAG